MPGENENENKHKKGEQEAAENLLTPEFH